MRSAVSSTCSPWTLNAMVASCTLGKTCGLGAISWPHPRLGAAWPMYINRSRWSSNSRTKRLGGYCSQLLTTSSRRHG
ncbi:unnamed protein product [Symbiodinium sp. CCMP2456]|nr:unnamed protein product [Symbiodinium sp. CCMP2456]